MANENESYRMTDEEYQQMLTEHMALIQQFRLIDDTFFAVCFDKKPELVEFILKIILDKAPIPHQIVKMGIYSPVDCELPLVISCDRAFFSIRSIKGKYGKSAFKNDAGFPKRKSAQSTQNQVISKAKAQVTEVFDSLS